MFKKTLIFGIVLGITSLGFAKGTETAKAQVIEPKLIWEKDLSDLDIQEVSDLSPEGIKALGHQSKDLR